MRATVAPNLAHAFGGIFRLTLRRYSTAGHWLTLLGSLGLLALVVFGGVGRRGADPFFDWTISFFLTFLVPGAAFISAAGALRDELKSSTTDYVFTRPVPRWAFVVFRYVSHVLCIQLDFLLALAVVLGIGLARDIPGILPAVPLLLLAQFLLVAAFSAFGFLCAMLTSRYVIIGLLYGGIVEIGIGQIPTQLNQLAVTHQARALLRPLLESPVSSAELSPIAAVILGTLFTLVMLAATIAVFSRREFVGDAEA